MWISFLFSLIFLFVPLKAISQPCEVAFSTSMGFAMLRSFDLKSEKTHWVALIEKYNPQLDLQLKRSGHSIEAFRAMIDLHNQALMFLYNFYKGNIYGTDNFFIGRLNSYPVRSSAPLIGRIVRKISLKSAVVEVITASGDLKRVEVEISSSFKFDYHSENRRDVFDEGFHVFMKNGDFNVSIKQGSPKLDMVFAALKSNRKRLDSSLLGVPKRTNEEQKLKVQGFNSAYVRGMDEVNEWIAVALQIRKLKINPYKTHIDYFADKVKTHIDYMRKGLTSADFPALRALERLERHAELTVQKEGVTYNWWLRFNYALSRVYDLTKDTDGVVQEMHAPTKVDINNIVNRFPAYIIMPTILGKMGVMAINRANIADVYVGGLINKPEGGHSREKLVSPGWFFNHDISVHSISSINVKSTYFDRNYENFYKYLVEKIQILPVGKRKNAELALFILMHEGDGGVFIYKPSSVIRSSIHNTLEAQMFSDFNFRGLMDTPPNELRQIHDRVKVIADDFITILEEVREQNNFMPN